MADTRGERPVVLAVDDDEEVLETYELWLADEYDLRTATDGAEALERIDETVDVVLLDRLMPEVSGAEVLERIRDRGFDCRVAMATAVEPDEDIVDMPFDAYVTKALERESVRETIEELLARSDADDSVQEHYAVAEKLAALEGAKSDTELAESEEYQRLRDRFEELDASVSDAEDSFTRDDLVDTLGDLDPGSAAGGASDPAPPDAYDLLSGTDADATRPVPPGTTLLVSAPMPAGREFVLRSLESGVRTGAGGLIITTKESTPSLLGAVEWGTVDLLRVVDCRNGSDRGEADHPAVVQDVDTPRNLTDIGIGFTNAFSEFDELGVDRGRFGLLSLSVVLSYVDQETAYRFCQTLARGLEQEGFLGLFLLDRDAHDERTENTLRRAVDGRVEIRPDGERYELRVTDLEAVSDEWVTLP